MGALNFECEFCKKQGYNHICIEYETLVSKLRLLIEILMIDGDLEGITHVIKYVIYIMPQTGNSRLSRLFIFNLQSN